MHPVPTYKGDSYPLFDRHEALKEEVRKFFELLNLEEESDSGTRFNPIYISSCRVMYTEQMWDILDRMEKLAK